MCFCCLFCLCSNFFIGLSGPVHCIDFLNAFFSDIKSEPHCMRTHTALQAYPKNKWNRHMWPQTFLFLKKYIDDQWGGLHPYTHRIANIPKRDCTRMMLMGCCLVSEWGFNFLLFSTEEVNWSLQQKNRSEHLQAICSYTLQQDGLLQVQWTSTGDGGLHAGVLSTARSGAKELHEEAFCTVSTSTIIPRLSIMPCPIKPNRTAISWKPTNCIAGVHTHELNRGRCTPRTVVVNLS